MVLYKKNIIRTVLLTLILITIFSSFQINVQAQSTISYTFQESSFIDWTNPVPDFSMNLRNQTYYTDTYNGTYSFTDDNDGDDPAGWIVNNQVPTIEVVSDIERHDKILMVYDNDNGGSSDIEQIFSIEFGSQESGTIEYWFLTDDATYRHYFSLFGLTDNRLQVLDNAETFWYTDGGGLHDTGVACLDNIWYHIRIDFEHGAGAYLGLSADRWNLWINYELIGTYTFANNGAWADRIKIQTSTPDNGYRGYFDAFKYSFDTPYEFGDNVIPYHYLNETQDISKWEFFNNENGTTTQFNQEVIPFWNELLAKGRIINGRTEFVDETCIYFDIDDNDHEGIEKSIDVNSGIVKQINFTFTWGLFVPGSERCYIYFDINSYDDTLIVRLRIDDDAVQGDLILSYYDGVNYIELLDVDDFVLNARFNITIVNSIVVFEALSEKFVFPILSAGKSGLGDIKIESYKVNDDDSLFLWIDSIGVYIDGVSVSNDYSNYYYEVVDDFNQKEFNLFNINATGNFSCSMYTDDPFVSDFSFFEYQNSSNISFMNIYDDFVNIIPDSYIMIVSNCSFTINSLSITGVSITDGIDNYHAIITHNSINSNESYFYVDSSNRLRFSLIVNDNDSEFIQASFNIPDIQAENRSISFMSNIDGSSLGFFRTMYTDDTSSFVPFPIWLSTSNVILPQTQEIENLAILITDNDKDDNDYCYGFVSNVQLIYITGSETTITTLNLMMVIVPIIVLLVPTFGIASKYGKNVILPMFILMSIICFIGQLIPLWIFFVIVISAGAFLFMKYKRGIE